jgi:ATP-binding cassette, subfamily B, multidrug efflux pump
VKKLLFVFLRPYRLVIAAIFVIVLGQAIGNLYLPTLNAEIINRGVGLGDTGYILRTGGIMLAVAVGIALGAILSSYSAARTAMGAGVTSGERCTAR